MPCSPGGPWCFTATGPEREDCDVDGAVEVRLAPSLATPWADALPCAQHATGFPGPAGTQVDPLTGQAVFECDGASATSTATVNVSASV